MPVRSLFSEPAAEKQTLRRGRNRLAPPPNRHATITEKRRQVTLHAEYPSFKKAGDSFAYVHARSRFAASGRD